MSAIVLLLTNTYTSLELILFSMLVLLLPSSQSAIQLVNYLITSLLEPRILPKLDFFAGVPDDCKTLVAIPSLLFNPEQVRRLCEDLEVRFLGNHDPNIHFALLTDLPDSPEPSPRRRSADSILCATGERAQRKIRQPGFGVISSLPSSPGLQPATKACGWVGSASAAS